MIVLGILVLVFLVLTIAFGFAASRREMLNSTRHDAVVDAVFLVVMMATAGLSVSLAAVAIVLG